MIELHPDVSAAMQSGQGVVALESTIVTHGMPYPQNLETALSVENRVREEGCVPATIAVIDGSLKVGLDEATLTKLANNKQVMKLSRADLAFAIASGQTGSTTVAATMIAAHLAGIRVFATGGIGGVHRGAETSFDISADLQELAKTPVNVVCAGAKAILNIPLTLEVLETLGVPVVTWREDTLPAFWSRDSGIESPLRLDELNELARFIESREQLGLSGAVLIANPVPADVEIDRITIEAWITTAMQSADANGVSGKAVTPYLLAEIARLSNGKSLQCNIALIHHNATLAACLASELTSRSPQSA